MGTLAGIPVFDSFLMFIYDVVKNPINFANETVTKQDHYPHIPDGCDYMLFRCLSETFH